MSIKIGDNIQQDAPKQIDNRWGVFANGAWRPYLDKQEVLDLNAVQSRFIGQIFQVGTISDQELYWFKSAVSGGGDLVPLSNREIRVYNETPSGIINGSNAIFNSAFAFVPESLVVTMNGLRIKPIDEFSTTGNTQITLTFSPTVGELILINYTKA